VSTTLDTGRSVTGRRTAAGLTAEQIWRALGRASFAVLGHITGSGAPRSSGVVYTVFDRRMFVVVAADGWKARHIAADGRVAVTVPIRRGGVMSLLFPIPPATISFPASATVYPANSRQGREVLKHLAHLLPAERQDTGRIVEIRPEGWFVTYGVGVRLMTMRHPELARSRVPVA
jgi:hypothetical protein